MRIAVYAVGIIGLVTSLTSIAENYKVVNTNTVFDTISKLDSHTEFEIPNIDSSDFWEVALVLDDRLVFSAVDSNGSRELYSYSNNRLTKLSGLSTTGFINSLSRIGKNRAVFKAENGLFETDGTVANTKKIHSDDFIKSSRISSIKNIIRIDDDGIVYHQGPAIKNRKLSGEETIIYSGEASSYTIAKVGRYSITSSAYTTDFIDSLITDGSIENTHKVSIKKINSPDRPTRNVTPNYNEDSMYFLSQSDSGVVFSKLTDDGFENIVNLNKDFSCGEDKINTVDFFSVANIVESKNSYYISNNDSVDLIVSRTENKNSCVVVVGKNNKKIEDIIDYNKEKYPYADLIGVNSAGQLIAVVDQWKLGDYSLGNTRFEKMNILIHDPTTKESSYLFDEEYRSFEFLNISESNFVFNLVDFNSPENGTKNWRTSIYRLNLSVPRLTKISGNSNNLDQYGRPAGFALVNGNEDLAQFFDVNGTIISFGYFPFFGMYSFTDKIDLLRLDDKYYRDDESGTSEWSYFSVSNGWIFKNENNNQIGHMNFRGEFTKFYFPVSCGYECEPYFNGVISDGSDYYVKIDIDDEPLLFKLNKDNTIPIDKIVLDNKFHHVNINSVINANPVVDGKYLKWSGDFYDFKNGVFVEPQYQCGTSRLFINQVEHKKHIRLISQAGNQLFSSEHIASIEFSAKELGNILITAVNEKNNYEISLLDCRDGILTAIPEDKQPFPDFTRAMAFNHLDGKYYYFTGNLLYSLNSQTGVITLIYDATQIKFPYGIKNLAFVGNTVLFWPQQSSPMDESKVYYIKAGIVGDIYLNDGLTHQFSLVKGQYNIDDKYIYGYYRRASNEFNSGSQKEIFIFNNDTLEVKFLDVFPESSRSDIHFPKLSSGRIMYKGSAPGFNNELVMIDPACVFDNVCDWENSPPNVDMNFALYYATGDHFNIPVRAIDSDFDKLTFRLDGKQSWMNVTADGYIKGVIPDNAKASNPITITVDDGINSVSQTFSLNVVSAIAADVITPETPPTDTTEPEKKQDSSGGGTVDMALLSALLLLLFMRKTLHYYYTNSLTTKHNKKPTRH